MGFEVVPYIHQSVGITIAVIGNSFFFLLDWVNFVKTRNGFRWRLKLADFGSRRHVLPLTFGARHPTAASLNLKYKILFHAI